MWQIVSRFILQARVWIFVGVAIFIVVMIYLGQGLEMDYGYASGKIIPSTHPDYVYYQRFKKIFGDDGKVMFVGFKKDSLENLQGLQAIYELSERLKHTEGVERVLSITHAPILYVDSTQKIKIRPLFEHKPTKADVDSFAKQIQRLIFYKHVIFNPDNNVSIIAINLKKEVLDSKKRIEITQNIKKICQEYEAQLGGQLYYSGLPYIRSAMVLKVSQELIKFLILSVVVTIVILYLFFRWIAIIPVSLFVTGLGVIFSRGLMSALGYKVNLLTALVPTLVMIIGIPNTIYFVTKYIELYRRSRNKVYSVKYIIEHIGAITLMNNLVTSLGFLSLSFTQIEMLQQFGLVAGISIIVTYILCLLLIPTFLIIIPAPKNAQFKHLDSKFLNGFVRFIEFSVRARRPVIYTIALALIAICSIGMTHLKANSYMLDDIPKKDVLQRDLKFFEDNLNGVMPLELVIDTQRKNGLLSLSALRKMEKVSDTLYQKYSAYLSKPISMIEILKFATQVVYYGNDTMGYTLPTASQYRNMATFIIRSKDSIPILSSLVDKDLRTARITFQMKDVGSKKLTELFPQIRKDVQSVMDTTCKIHITGSSVMFSWGNYYLINNLIESIIVAFVLIAILMGILFFNFKMLIISLLPNIIPLVLTAGIMGFTNVLLKPSTVIIFSITFGMTIDNAIRFLARYRVERKKHKLPVKEATYRAIYESGISEIYTSIILLFGFGIFLFSEFGGTQAMGMLVSLCLGIAMFSNLFVLPALTISIAGERDKGEGIIDLPDEEENGIKA
ncbi:MAG: MMPL family transporter [Bacteroidia bacterium]|nr:MMPL family transporter [Bacteroidia bacterium]MDW8301774.1 MMPL family transporter [Bacteroidia bacterium]